MSTRSHAVSLILFLVAAFAPMPGVFADDGDPEPAASGPVYKNTQIGLTARGPAGWKMAADKGGGSEWTRLATFWDPTTSAEAVLSRRKRTHAGLADLLASVRKDWEEAKEISITNMRTIPASAVDPKGSIAVDGTYVLRPKAKGPNDPPPAPVTWRVAASYYLSPADEYLLYVKAQATHWSRVRSELQRMRKSIAWKAKAAGGPKGEGAYRDERNGFACVFPKAYTVVIPERSRHIVQFEGVSGDDPVIGVYRFTWDEALDRDVQRLLEYYREELAGEATARSFTVSGKPGQLITAHANIGGRDQTVLLAIVKRGSDDFIRVKAQMPQSAEGTGKPVFLRFVQGFKLGPKPR